MSKPHTFVVLCSLLASLTAADAPTTSDLRLIQVPVTLDKPGYVTAVIEDDSGRRVCNLVSESQSQAGATRYNWDFYDVGIQPGMTRITENGKDRDAC